MSFEIVIIAVWFVQNWYARFVAGCCVTTRHVRWPSWFSCLQLDHYAAPSTEQQQYLQSVRTLGEMLLTEHRDARPLNYEANPL